jgi:hypothetical protein
MAEQYIFIFVIGYVLGVISTIFFNRRGLTVESTVALLIISIWITLHTYGFFFDKPVSLLMDFAGFGAAGNFIGIKISDFSDYVVKVGRKR